MTPPPPGDHARDEDTFDEEVLELFDAEVKQLFGYLLNLGVMHADADDLVQDAFMATRGQWRRVRTFDVPRSYPYKVATHGWSKLCRKRRREVLLAEPLDVPEQDGIAAVAPLEVRDMLACLAIGQQQVFLLREVYGFPTRETGEILGISEGTVKSQLHDAKQRLLAFWKGGDR